MLISLPPSLMTAALFPLYLSISFTATAFCSGDLHNRKTTQDKGYHNPNAGLEMDKNTSAIFVKGHIFISAPSRG